ncbi:hypothetical protein PIIN_11183 [Serendipita indica DSM 11827]|uniref:Uncharacterized protein n=1 Tax=Serendipita indica (strain DSM 11827) TaxID=1109443 RepID=G4U0V8_SERID|nr:hypothetical protein PIIN_11183 [Serendipita indica DSM 11827]
MPEIDDSAKGYDLVGEADVLAEGKDPEWLDNRDGRRGLRSAGDGCVVDYFDLPRSGLDSQSGPFDEPGAVQPAQNSNPHQNLVAEKVLVLPRDVGNRQFSK